MSFFAQRYQFRQNATDSEGTVNSVRVRQRATELFPASLLQSNSRAPAVLFDELDASHLERPSNDI